MSLCFILAVNVGLYGQTCQGSLGDPVVHIDFGSGESLFGKSIGQSTNYSFVQTSQFQDGSYTIIKKMGGEYGGAWHEGITNHTPNDPNGYLMAVGANDIPGIFYETAIDEDLCPNTTYEFAAWVMNLMRLKGNRPNLTFYILKPDGEVLRRFDTGDIVEREKPTWEQHGFLFTTSNVSRVRIRIVNNGPGGYGNDLALDDITFRACGPQITTVIDNEVQQEKTICEGNGVQLSVQVAGSSTLQYLWQKQEGTVWKDLPGENTTSLSVSPSVLPAGDHQYRLVAAESTNFNSPACRTASSVIKLHVVTKPTAVSPQVVCPGNDITLKVNASGGTYVWTGPKGFYATVPAPVLQNADQRMAGIYKVKVSLGDCVDSTEIDIQVKSPPVAVVNSTAVDICEDGAVVLNASGGTIYKWSPAAGLSDTTASSPSAAPDTTTLYTVSVSNGGCADTASVLVRVLKKIVASAGKNRVVLEGQSITLDGQIVGDKVKYFWTPSDYLDDPAKLNPVATPLKDITYTLNAWSEKNCTGSSSSVSIKVYPRLEIPNSFSPNGDGINDVWNIPALEAYPEARINIYNRYGEKVFSSANGLKSWNGKYKGKEVPSGVYYYSLNLVEPKQTITGSIMVLR